MDVLAVILACSVYPDDQLVRAMVDLSSQGNPYFVGDVATLLTFDKSRSAADGKRLVSEIEKQGGRPAVGLLALPVAWSSRHGSASVDLFDGCMNVRVGSTVLRDHLTACTRLHSAVAPASSVAPGRTRTAPPEALRQCALRRFGADVGLEGFAEAVFQYLPRHRVLGTPDANQTSGANGAADCQCKAAPTATTAAPPKRKRAPQAGPILTDQPPPRPPATASDTYQRGNPGVSPILD